MRTRAWVHALLLLGCGCGGGDGQSPVVDGGVSGGVVSSGGQASSGGEASGGSQPTTGGVTSGGAIASGGSGTGGGGGGTGGSGGTGGEGLADAQMPDPMDGSMPDAGDAMVAPPGTTLCGAEYVDALVFGRMGDSVTFAPGAGDSDTRNPVEPGAGIDRAYIARTTEQGGVQWIAQAVSQTTLNTIQVSQAVYDPVEGAAYVAYHMRRPTVSVRFYNADGTLFREYAPEGNPEPALAGVQAQFNLFLARYDSAGMIQWLKRFGPNDPDASRGAQVYELQLLASSVRVSANASQIPPGLLGDGRLSFGMGEASSATLTHRGEMGVLGDFDRATGAYVDGTAFGMYADAVDVQTPFNGFATTNAAGDRVLAGKVKLAGVSSDTARFAGQAVTITEGTAVFHKTGSSGTWLRKITRADNNQAPDIHATRLLTDGSLVLAVSAYGPNSEITFQVDSGSGVQDLTLNGYDVLLLRYSPAGDVEWTRRIGRTTAPIYTDLIVDEAEGALYVVSPVSGAVAFEPNTSSEFALPSSTGAHVARFDLSSGVFAWVQPIYAADSLGSPIETTVADGALAVPISFKEATVTLAPDEIQTASGAVAFGLIYYTKSGLLQRCVEVVDSARAIVLD